MLHCLFWRSVAFLLVFLVTFEKSSSGLSGALCASPRAHLESGGLKVSLQEYVCCILKPRFACDLCWFWPARPTHQSCHRSSDFDISLNCAPATKNQWTRGKHEKFHYLRHVLHFSIIFSPVSSMPLPELWHTSAILQGVFTCCHKFLVIPTVLNWHGAMSSWSPQQFCHSYSTSPAWSTCGCYCCHLPWVQVPDYGSRGSCYSLTIISYMCICSASVQCCQQWKKLSWLNWEPHS